MVSYFRRIPAELFQQAEIDGANELNQFLTIALPLAAPTSAVLVVLNFLWRWNELLFSLLILQDDSKRTLMVGLTLCRGTTRRPCRCSRPRSCSP